MIPTTASWAGLRVSLGEGLVTIPCRAAPLDRPEQARDRGVHAFAGSPPSPDRSLIPGVARENKSRGMRQPLPAGTLRRASRFPLGRSGRVASAVSIRCVRMRRAYASSHSAMA